MNKSFLTKENPPSNNTTPKKQKKKWGFKVFVLCDTTGLVYDLSIYSGYWGWFKYSPWNGRDCS